MTSQDRFTLALHATWSVLRDPILTKIYMRSWKRHIKKYKGFAVDHKSISLYGFVFQIMYKTSYSKH